MELPDSLNALSMETARSLQGSARRLFLPRTVHELGPGGLQRAERALGWSRVTSRKGTRELDRGGTCLDALAAHGRKPVEAHWPTWLRAMKAIVESQSQTDPQFRTTRHSTPLRAADVRHQLIAQHGDAAAALPPVPTLTTQRPALDRLHTYTQAKRTGNGPRIHPPLASQSRRRQWSATSIIPSGTSVPSTA